MHCIAHTLAQSRHQSRRGCDGLRAFVHSSRLAHTEVTLLWMQCTGKCHTDSDTRGVIGYKPNHPSKDRNCSGLIASVSRHPPAVCSSWMRAGDPGPVLACWGVGWADSHADGCCLPGPLAHSLACLLLAGWLAGALYGVLGAATAGAGSGPCSARAPSLAGGFELIFNLAVSSSPHNTQNGTYHHPHPLQHRVETPVAASWWIAARTDGR